MAFWDPEELPDPLDLPERIIPDQEAAEDTDISESEDDDSKTQAKRTRADEESESSDSDPGVRDPNRWVDYLDTLPQTKRKLTKKEAKMKREEQWLNEDDNASEEVKKLNEAYTKTSPKLTPPVGLHTCTTSLGRKSLVPRSTNCAAISWTRTS